MQHCQPDDDGAVLLARAMTRFALSARSYHRILKVARTAADIEASERVYVRHVAEALGYRRVDTLVQ